VQQFSPAMFVDVIALQPLLPCTAADHPGAWRGVDHVDHPHGYHLSLLTSAHGVVSDHGQMA